MRQKTERGKKGEMKRKPEGEGERKVREKGKGKEKKSLIILALNIKTNFKIILQCTAL